MQQLGGSLGLAVLVTVFGSTSRDVASHPGAHESATALARHAFVAGADSAFWTATAMIAGALALVAAVIRIAPSRGAGTAVEAEPEMRDDVLVGTALEQA